MKARPVRIEGDQQRGFVVYVPLGRDGEDEAVLDLDDYNDLVALKVYPNWQLRGGQVGARGPGGINVLIARVLTDAKPGQRVTYRDGDKLNLRRSNLECSESGFSINHDRADLIEAADEFENRKLLAKESGTYHPRYAKPDFVRRDDSKSERSSSGGYARPARTRRDRLAAKKGRYNPVASVGM
jgi:hypothetical protein